MPDKRKHRGPAPGDRELFGPNALGSLRAAVSDLCWLDSRGYASVSSMQLVGNRYALTERQRKAARRCACSDEALEQRSMRIVAPEHVYGEKIEIDGYNVLTSVEAALSGGAILLGRDGSFRDMASMHGSYRKVLETRPAMLAIAKALQDLQPSGVRWLLDAPVSNSGRLATLMREIADEARADWTVELVPDPDRILIDSHAIVATADAGILDRCRRWFPLARTVVVEAVPDAWIVDLSTPTSS